MDKNINIYGIYFICCIGNYMNIVKEQLGMLESSGLLNITKKCIIFISSYNNEIDDLLKNDKFIVVTSTENVYERFAINNYKKYIDDDSYYLYYFHTKGVSRPDNDFFTKKRQILNFYTLQKFKINIDLLSSYDAVGCSLSLYPKKHFSGNFWWSKSSYLNTLTENIGTGYLAPEMYVLSGSRCKMVSLANDTNDNFIPSDEINITTNYIVIPQYKDLPC